MQVVRANRSEAKTALGSEARVANLPSSYCDEFVCTSSPSIELAVRSFAKDIERAKSWTYSLFASKVVYTVSASTLQQKNIHDCDYANLIFPQRFVCFSGMLVVALCKPCTACVALILSSWPWTHRHVLKLPCHF